jgi:hypothetical protein
MKTAALGLFLTALPGVAAADWDRPAPAYPGYQQTEEARPPCPSPQHRWVEPHWENQGGRQVYRPGYWQAPPAYQQPVYQNGGYQYAGYDQPPTEDVWVNNAPPPPQYEVRTRAPFAGAVWIPGYWRWTGHRHLWVGGRWTAPRAGFVWDSGGWRRHGNRWAFTRGYWRHR